MAKIDPLSSNQETRSPIFIEDFADIDAPFERMRDQFAGASEWLAPLASAASADGEALRLRIGPTWASGIVSREVQLALGPCRERGDAIFRSIAWRATGLPSLFPLVEGDIELAPIGLEGCRVSLAVVYTPPLGVLGASVDRALLHRVAASTVRSFIAKVAMNLRTAG
jgi:hypothetical protein